LKLELRIIWNQVNLNSCRSLHFNPIRKDRPSFKLILCLTLFASSFFAQGIVPTIAFQTGVPASAVGPNQSSNVTAVSASSIAINLTARPPVLPADNGSYPSIVIELVNLTSGLPVIPTSPVKITLTSSKIQIGNVSSSVQFPTGSLTCTATFHTTFYPGTTNITATANNYLPSSLSVTTETVGGLPSALDVFMSPAAIPANRNQNSSVIVEVVDAYGNPTKLPNGLDVSLSSSNLVIGSVPTSLVIPAGQTFGNVTFQPTYVAGTTTVTAHANGLLPGNATMTTVGPVAGRISLSVAPSLISTVPGETATLTVELLDNNTQTPVVASDPVQVVVTSNNNSVAILPDSIVTIEPGQWYATDTIQAGGAAGNASFDAKAQGYIPGTANITASYAPAIPANSCALYFAPNELLSNNGSYPGLAVVELQYHNATSGNVYPVENLGAPLQVYARSSDNITLQVSTSTGTIATDSFQTSFEVSSTYYSGSALITVECPGLNPDNATLTSYGVVPNVLTLQFAPPNLLTDGGTYPAVIVGLMNSATSQPADSPVNLWVNLTSSAASAGSIPSTVEIKAGTSYQRVNFKTSGLLGTDEIVATAPGFVSAKAKLSLVSSAATGLGLYAAPIFVLAGAQTYSDIIAVQLQDSNGAPAKTYSNITVELSSQNLATGKVSSSVVIRNGTTFSLVNLTTTSMPGQINIDAVASGLVSTSVNLTSALLPMNVSLSSSASTIQLNGTSLLSFYARSSGIPVPNATVTWSVQGGSNYGTLTKITTVTGSLGNATAMYHSGTILGMMLIQAEISKPCYSPLIANFTVNVYDPRMSTQVNLSPASIPVEGESNVTLVVASAGTPLANVSVSWTVSNGTMHESSGMTNANGTLQTVFQAGPTAGSVMINANITKPGYFSSIVSSRLNVFLPALTAQTVVEPSNVQAGNSAIILLAVQSYAGPVGGVAINWTAYSGSLSMEMALTNSSGYATAIFTAGSSSGQAVIFVTASKPYFSSYSENVTINVFQSQMSSQVTGFKQQTVTNYSQSFLLNVESGGVALSNASITWVVGNGTITNPTGTTNATGYAQFTYRSGLFPGNFTLQAHISKLGYYPIVENLTINVFQLLLNAQVIGFRPSIVTNYEQNFLIYVESNGTAVSNASVTWVVDNGTITNSKATTNATGYALFTYRSGPFPGNFTLQAHISKPGYYSTVENITIQIVQPAPPPPVHKPTNVLYVKVFSFLQVWMLILVVIVVGVASIFVIVRRRRSNSGDGGVDEDE
jgi:hypothetical protein